jgi:hypothetical protein
MSGSLETLVIKHARYRHFAIDAIPDLRVFEQLKDYELIFFKLLLNCSLRE